MYECVLKRFIFGGAPPKRAAKRFMNEISNPYPKAINTTNIMTSIFIYSHVTKLPRERCSVLNAELILITPTCNTKIFDKL